MPKGDSLELVRGSHTGPQYDRSAYEDPHDSTKPVRGEKWFPRLPDIEAEREAKLTLLDSNEGFASRLIGTPDTILLRTQDFHQLGIDCFLLPLHDKLFNREVLPALRDL